MLESVPHSHPQPQPEASDAGPVEVPPVQSAVARERLERFLRIRRAEARTPDSQPFRPTVTLSRQAGLNGLEFATRLGTYLDTLDHQNSGQGWICVDAPLIDTLIEHLGDSTSTYARVIPFPSKNGAALQSSATEPPHSPHSPATLALRRLCELGGAIIVGRGAHCPAISGDLENVFRVRLIADFEQRVSQFAGRAGMHDLDRAATTVTHIDESRHRHVQRHFHSDLDDPLAFDLVLNLSQITPDTAVAFIGDALLEWSAKRTTNTG
jgi:hypothetical protein